MTIWLRKHPLALAGSVALLVIAFGALFAPWLAPHPPDVQDLHIQLEGPSSLHPLGTDGQGADVLSNLLYGARVALLVGFGTVALNASIGTLLGAFAGYAGGRIDDALMRFVEILLSFPGILLAILIIFVTQEPSLLTVILALSATGWAGYARLVRGQVLLEKEKPYIEAARAAGLSHTRIVMKYILPNVLSPVLVQGAFGVATAILAESSLSFLGLGPQDVPSWGRLLDQGASYFLVAQHLAIAPGVAIMVAVLSVNLVGDAIRDTLDPKTRK